MSNPSMPNNSEPPRVPQIEQHLEGDRNQAIGQVLGGIVVYVSGGQAVFQSASTTTASSTSKATPSEIGPNPYKGLMAFQETDGDRFFGREKQIAALWEKFRSLHETEGAIRVLPIYGPSGSGKSSLARAGLIPELERHSIPGYDRARVAVLVPGTHPLEALATVLARIVTQDLTPVAKTREFVGELKQINENKEYDGLRRIANVLPNINISPLIVLVDQFEEVYSYEERGNDPESQQKQKTFLAEREAFIANLLCAAKDRSKQVMVIITLRTDFLEETQKHLELNHLFSSQGFLVPTMSESELREAISNPAKQAGQELDEATVSLLIEQTRGREGALPLLQFTLEQIWEGLRKNARPVETLKQIGGVGGALAKRAQELYDSLSDLEKAIARRVFLGLVQLGEGTRDTRRRVAIENLISHKDDPTQFKTVIGKFAQHNVRMIRVFLAKQEEETAEVPYAEVTHEALFDHWQQLQEWLEVSRDDIRFQRRLDEAARYWHKQGRLEGNLWRPPDLDLLKQYQQRVGEDMTSFQIEFFEASQTTEETRKQREQKQKQFQKWAIVGLSTISVLAVGSAGSAFLQLQQAQRQRVEQFAANAQVAFSTQQPIDGMLNAIVAVGLSRSTIVQLPNYPAFSSAYKSLWDALQVSRERTILLHKDRVFSVAFSPDGKTIVSGSAEKILRLWDTNTGQLIKQMMGHEEAVSSVAFSPDGKTIVSGSWDRTLRLWDAKTGQPIGQPLRGHEERIFSVAFSPDSKTIVSGSEDKTLRLWDAKTGQPIKQPLRHEDVIFSVAFSPDGKYIASGSASRIDEGKASYAIHILNAHTGELLEKFWSGQEDISSVAFSPDSKMIVTGGSARAVIFWAVGQQAMIPIDGLPVKQPIGEFLRGHNSQIFSVAFSPNGKVVATGSHDHTVRLWNTNIGQPNRQLGEHASQIHSFAFSPNGKTIVTGSGAEDQVDPSSRLGISEKSTLQLWDAHTGQPIGQPLRGHKDTVYSVAFSPNGKTIVSGSWDKTVRLWDAKTGQPIGQPLQGHEDMVYSVAFSPDGKTIVSGSRDKTIRLWDAKTGQPMGQPLRGDGGIISVNFSPDGRTLIASSGSIFWFDPDIDTKVLFWNAITGKPIEEANRLNMIPPVVFSPDGKTIVTSNGVWDTSTGTIRYKYSLEGLGSFITFSPDGKTIVTSNGVWDTSTGTIRYKYSTPFKGFDGVFSPDGKTLATNGGRLWSISWESLIEEACNQLQHHPSLIEPQTDVAKEAKQTCEQYIWKK